MWRQHAHHGGLELFHHLRGHFFFIDSLVLGNSAFQRPALVHRRCRDYSARIRHRFHALLLPRGDLHIVSPPKIASLRMSAHSNTGLRR